MVRCKIRFGDRSLAMEERERTSMVKACRLNDRALPKLNIRSVIVLVNSARWGNMACLSTSNGAAGHQYWCSCTSDILVFFDSMNGSLIKKFSDKNISTV